MDCKSAFCGLIFEIGFNEKEPNNFGSCWGQVSERSVFWGSPLLVQLKTNYRNGRGQKLFEESIQLLEKQGSVPVTSTEKGDLRIFLQGSLAYKSRFWVNRKGHCAGDGTVIAGQAFSSQDIRNSTNWHPLLGIFILRK
uniref:Calpain catalytic domain-containing protein n=1 Tax=Mesocestoides corti TaxID=53468 RepID=A0A5K3EV35_MESCO